MLRHAEADVIGPRKEQPCGCVGDTLDGVQIFLPCPDHRLYPGPDVYGPGGLVQRFVTMGDLVLPVNRVRMKKE